MNSSMDAGFVAKISLNISSVIHGNAFCTIGTRIANNNFSFVL